MKKTFCHTFVISILFFIGLASCSDSEKYPTIVEDDLPEAVQDFIHEYLPSNKFVSATKNDAIYTVQLEGNVELVVPQVGGQAWFVMSSGKGLPDTALKLLEDESLKELKENYSGSKVVNLWKKYENDNLQLILDDTKKLKEISGHEGYTLAELLEGDALNTIPDKVKKFASLSVANNARMSIVERPLVLKYSGFRGDIYRVIVLDTKGLVADFYKDGEWFFIDTQGAPSYVFESLIALELPDAVKKTLTTTYPNVEEALKKMQRFNNGKYYGFTSKNKAFTLIDAEGKILEAPLEQAKKIIKEGFSPTKELAYEVIPNTGGGYFLRYAFVAKGQGEIRMATDVSGNLRNISAGPVTTSGEGVVPLPKAVLNMFPSKIMEYLEVKDAVNSILSISHSYSVSQEDIPDEVNFTMLIPNNFKILIFDPKTGEYLREYDVIGKH